jgi:HSP20 family molecular chaperone IbpA
MIQFYPISREFDEIFDTMASTATRSAPSYPPYNLSTDGENGLIEIAATGLSEKDIKVYFDEDGLLTAEGTYPDKDEKEYTHKGLSKKNFKRKFRLEKYKVQNATLENGLLSIEIAKETPKLEFIPINSKNENLILESNSSED